MSKKIPTAILGATGVVGQRFVQMLQDHPWFEITALVASDRSAGQIYGEACNWTLEGDPPANLLDMQVLPLDAETAGPPGLFGTADRGSKGCGRPPG